MKEYVEQMRNAHIYADGVDLSTEEELRKHRCVKCGYEWFEYCDTRDYPYFCPGCGCEKMEIR